MPRPIRATISASALAHNLMVAKAYASGARLWAVVKANAYGHGIERAARAFAAADGFAVLDFQEAARLRLAGVTKPILMLEGFFKAAAHPTELEVYLKVNSGMNRLGFASEAVRPAYNAVRMHPHVKSVTLM